MHIQPISKSIYDRAKELGLTEIKLVFRGGNDEGFLDIETEPSGKLAKDLYDEIDTWAWKVYEYSGAGDGSDYGDNITYELNEDRVSWDSWYQAVQDGDGSAGRLVVGG